MSAGSGPTLQDRVLRVLGSECPGPATAIVAVSGGPDSVALLDLVAAAAPALELTLVVAHLDHGIQAESAGVAARVAAAAARYGLRYRTHRVELGRGATETAARAPRRAWLETVADEEGAACILTAHHRDDQVETMVMRFLKGSGPAGLAGIRSRGRWIRPLLETSRDEILSYLAQRHLEFWQDPTNADERHLRGWVRHHLLPRIERRVPDVRANLSAAAGVFEENRQAWDQLLDQLPDLGVRREPDGVSVAADPLRGYSSAVVRSLLKAVGFRIEIGLGRGSLDRLQRLVLQGHTGQAVDLAAGAGAELSFGRLKLFRWPAHLEAYRLPFAEAMVTGQVGDWQLACTTSPTPDLIPRDGFVTWMAPDPGLVIRPWQAGDRIRPIRGRGTRLVVRCMQDSKVPRSRRPKWPVFEYRGEVIWVPGVCRSDGLLPDPTALAMRIDVSPR